MKTILFLICAKGRIGAIAIGVLGFWFGYWAFMQFFAPSYWEPAQLDEPLQIRRSADDIARWNAAVAKAREDRNDAMENWRQSCWRGVQQGWGDRSWCEKIDQIMAQSVARRAAPE
jgi:hypothetical protein